MGSLLNCHRCNKETKEYYRFWLKEQAKGINLCLNCFEIVAGNLEFLDNPNMPNTCCACFKIDYCIASLIRRAKGPIQGTIKQDIFYFCFSCEKKFIKDFSLDR